VKSAIVLFVAGLMALVVVAGAPAGLAQVDSNTDSAPADQPLPPDPCTLPPDVPIDGTNVDADGNPIDPNGAALCTPTPGADSPPLEAAPTDTPTPIMPTDTPVPAPTDTPVPTDTPTPLPPQPTATSTPTSSSRDVPAGTLARQLPFENPGETSCDVFIENTANACDPQTFPAVFTLKFVSSTLPIKVQVDNRAPQSTSDTSVDFLFVPGGMGSGNHTVTASETTGPGTTVSTKLQLSAPKPTSPHLLVYPRAVAPGSNAQVWLAGFPANAELPLGVYRQRQDCTAFAGRSDCYELVHDLGTVKTGSDGSAHKNFSIAANEPATSYLVATPNLRIRPQNSFEDIRALGRPWFVVAQP
jgi:hypothetical protein